MTSNQNLESFVPVYDAIPEDWERARMFLVEQLKRLANSVNQRSIGQYYDVELLTGNQFIPTTTNPQVNRQIFRKVIDFGTLPDTLTTSIPHGITFDNNFTLVNLYAAATDPVAFDAVPIPYASPTAADEIELNMDTNNINITTAKDYTSFTRCYVVIDYMQEI